LGLGGGGTASVLHGRSLPCPQGHPLSTGAACDLARIKLSIRRETPCEPLADRCASAVGLAAASQWR
jgi:hypothetical protein